MFITTEPINRMMEDARAFGPASNGQQRRAKHPSWNKMSLTYVVIFSFVVLLASTRTILRPAYNWDLIGYIGCVQAMQFSDPTVVHRRAFDEVQRTVPADVFGTLTSADKYHRVVAADADAFYQQLPFYRVKPLYVGLLYLLIKGGCTGITATTTISVASYILIAAICYLWVTTHVQGLGGLMLSALTALTPRLLETAALATPDLLSSALLLAGMYQLLERKSIPCCSVMFLLCLLVRPDNILFLLVLMMGLKVFGAFPFRLTTWQYLGGSISVMGIYIVIAALMKGYPTRVLFEHTFVGLITHPAEHIPAVTLTDYLRALLKAGDAFGRSHVILYLIPACLCAWLQRHIAIWKHGSIYPSCLYIMVAAIFVRMLIHPAVFDRFFIGYFVTIEMICLVCVSRLASRRVPLPKEETQVRMA